MNPLGLVLGGAALVGISVGIGVHWAGRRTHNPRDLEEIAYLAGQVDEAERMLKQFTGDPFLASWQPVPSQKWARLQQARKNPRAN